MRRRAAATSVTTGRDEQQRVASWASSQATTGQDITRILAQHACSAAAHETSTAPRPHSGPDVIFCSVVALTARLGYCVRTIAGHKVMVLANILSDASLEAVERERRSERMEQRVRPTVKQIIEAAATTVGQDQSDFVTTAAYERALAVLKDRLATRLPMERLAAFAAALDRPAKPSRQLVELMAEYERDVDDPIR